MNQKELNEIRRRFKLDKNSISKIFWLLCQQQ